MPIDLRSLRQLAQQVRSDKGPWGSWSMEGPFTDADVRKRETRADRAEDPHGRETHSVCAKPVRPDGSVDFGSEAHECILTCVGLDERRAALIAAYVQAVGPDNMLELLEVVEAAAVVRISSGEGAMRKLGDALDALEGKPRPR